MEEKGTKKEKIQSIIIAVLSLIIVFGVAFFASELKYCDVKEEIQLEEIGMNEFITLLNDESDASDNNNSSTENNTEIDTSTKEDTNNEQSNG